MKRVRQLGILLLAAAISVGAGFASPTLYHDYRLATSSTSEPFTELYFNNLLTLPPTVEKGKTQTISFSIVNHEAKLTTYPYRVIIDEGGRTTIRIGQVTLHDNQPVGVPVKFTATKTSTPIIVTIELPEQNQQIHFRSTS